MLEAESKCILHVKFVIGWDYGIHGTNNPSSIGKAVSNGCVRTYTII
jgi:hypothetical protein